ncbi:MAG TPA: amidinotransferase [Cytophagales bacterium]|nr:amidinotransferase [Cytophagales bacterium]HAP61135.1 amidinotransferase [Cytophagales bacterium]
MQSEQLPQHIFLIRPAHFGANTETASTNAFQAEMDASQQLTVEETARKEFDQAIAILEENQVMHQVFEDTESPTTTDAVFPNNWISTHANGKVIIYPMMAPSRRLERRPELIGELENACGFEVKELVNLAYFEKNEQYCEGTGSLVIDHANGILYAALSDRTHREVVMQVAEELGYDPLFFTANGPDGKPIYHTNVMMALGDSFAIICMESIQDPAERQLVTNVLKKTKHQIEEISTEQMGHFAGNVFPVINQVGKKLLLMSQQAHDALTIEQRVRWSAYGKLVPIPVPTIEKYGGGSIRCMIAGVHLPKTEA